MGVDRSEGIHTTSIWNTGKGGFLRAVRQLFGCFLLKIFVTAASQSCHKDDKFFEVHLGIAVFIQVLENFINGILVLPRLQKKRRRLR